jgi:hypothetical protein
VSFLHDKAKTTSARIMPVPAILLNPLFIINVYNWFTKIEKDLRQGEERSTKSRVRNQDKKV